MNLTNQSERDSLVRYVSNMYDIYGSNYLPEPGEDIDIDVDVEEIVKELENSHKCSYCNQEKMFDEVQCEHYCPVCE